MGDMSCHSCHAVPHECVLSAECIHNAVRRNSAAAAQPPAFAHAPECDVVQRLHDVPVLKAHHELHLGLHSSGRLAVVLNRLDRHLAARPAPLVHPPKGASAQQGTCG
jgi:hypothetical protein